MPHQPYSTRRLIWASAAFLIGFAVLISVLAKWWLLPATAAMAQADEAGRHTLSAYSTLLMILVLLILLTGLFLVFRVGRFFVGTSDAPKSPPLTREPSQSINVKPFQK